MLCYSLYVSSDDRSLRDSGVAGKASDRGARDGGGGSGMGSAVLGNLSTKIYSNHIKSTQYVCKDIGWR